jgi:natural product biosynthesis luciferase-like monooxygenase protein
MFFSRGEGRSAASSYDAIRDIARFADREGFDRVWLPERHFVEFGALHPNPAVLAAALAVETSRVRLAGGSVVAPLHDPIRIAEEWALVDNLSHGRIDIAFASGWREQDFALADALYDRRHEVLRQRIADVQTLWSGGTIERQTRAGVTTHVSTFPRPVQAALPLWVTAARSTDTFETAGALGANVLTYLVDVGLDGLQTRIAAYRRARASAGLQGDSGCVTVMLHTYLGDDSDTVRSFVEPAYCRYLSQNRSLLSEFGGRRELSEQSAEQLARAQFSRVFEHLSLIGSIDRCAAIVEALRKMGVNEIACLVDFIADFDAARAALPYIVKLRGRVSADVPRALSKHEIIRMDLPTFPIVSADAHEFYRYIQSLGGNYGPSFRLVERVIANESSAVAFLVAPAEGDATHARALLTDAAISAAHAIGMTPGLRASSRPLALPIGIGRGEFHDVVSEKYHVYISRSGADTNSAEFDIQVATPEGKLKLALERVRFQRIPIRRNDSHHNAAQALIHEVSWTQVGRSSMVFDDQEGAPRSAVITAQNDLDQCRLTAILQDAGWSSINDEDFESARDGVRFLVAHSLEKWLFGDMSAPRAAVIHIAAWVARSNSAPETGPLVVLVRGANAVLQSDPPPDTIAAAAWAAAASLASGTTRRQISVIDLDPRITAGEQIVLVAEFSARIHAGLFAVRDGVFYTQSIEPRLVENLNAEPAVFLPLAGPNRTALVTGGTGALGRPVAAWLAEEGITQISLLSRTASRVHWLPQLLAKRSSVKLIDADIAARCNAERVPPEVDLVFHLAGDIVDANGTTVDEEVVNRCFAPKLDGLLHLHEALKLRPPKRLILFSSISGIVGSAGQSAYAAANAAMSAAARQLPGFEEVDVRVIWFGPWSGAGMSQGDQVQAILKAKGVIPMHPSLALRALSIVLSSSHHSAVVVQRANASHAEAAVAIREIGDKSTGPLLSETLLRLRQAPVHCQMAMMEAEIARQVASVMDMDATKIDHTRSLYEIGFDSLMAIELRNVMRIEYGIEVGLSELMQSDTINAIANSLLPTVLKDIPLGDPVADTMESSHHDVGPPAEMRELIL